jgi:hypothetical protein
VAISEAGFGPPPVSRNSNENEASAPRRKRDRSSMEGTSGAARSCPLRGGSRASGPASVLASRKRGEDGRRDSMPLTRYGGSVTRSWKTASLRQGSAGSVDPRRARNASRGAIRRRRSALATRGVRADRVGVELPGAARGNASAARGARIDESRPPLARETSAGSRSHGSDERKLAWKRVRPSRGAVSACDRAAHLPRQVGMRRSRGGARGLCWLQKSTSDARSKVERPRV